MGRPQRLLAELRQLAASTEELIDQIGGQPERPIIAARERARETVSRIRSHIGPSHASRDGAHTLRSVAQVYLQEKGWPALVALGLTALLLAALLRR